MKRILLVLLIGAMVAMAGCAADTNGDDAGDSEPAEMAEFSENVTFPWNAITSNQIAVEVTVENAGNGSGTYEAALTANGEEVATDSVSVDAGESTTLSLHHTFEETGEYDLAVGDEERTISVYESPRAYFESDNDPTGTQIIEQETTIDASVIYNEQTFDFTSDGEATVRKNFTAQTQYKNETSTIEVGMDSWDETTESWIVDGTLYEKTTDYSTGEVNYTSEPSDEFEDEDRDFPDEILDEYLQIQDTGDEYIFTLAANTPDDAATLWGAMDQNAGSELPPSAMTSVTMEVTMDKALLKPTEMTMEVSAENVQMDDSGGFETFDMTLEQEFVGFNETVDVEVPEEVKEATSN